MGKRKFSDETIEAAVEMREQGLTLGQIVRMTGMSEGAIDYHCKVLGADIPPERWSPTKSKGPVVTRRGDHFVRRFSCEEDRVLLEMSLTGQSRSAIGRVLKRRTSSVAGRLITLARHEARAET